MYRRHSDRINERDVPESQHAIFIRGLAGHITTSEIREFFEDEFGSCSFDFIKMSKDREQLHVAVRFESKTAARECMEKYHDGEIFGSPVQLTWFRDIRRYLNHIQKQYGSSSGRGRRRFDDDVRKRNIGRLSRSGSRLSHSPDSRREKSASRSQSHYSSGQSENNQTEKAPIEHRSISPEPKKNSQKKIKKDRKKKKRQSSSRSRSRSPHFTETNPPSRNRDCLQNDNGGLGEAPMETSDDDLVKEPLSASRFSMTASVPNLGANSSYLNAPFQTLTSTNPNYHRFAEAPSAATILKNTSFTLDLTSNNPPRQNIKKYDNINQNDNFENNDRKNMSQGYDDKWKSLESPTLEKEAKKEYRESKRDVEHFKKIEKSRGHDNNNHKSARGDFLPQLPLPLPMQLPPPPPAVKHQVEPAAKSPSPTYNGALTNFKSIQRLILQDVRYKPSESSDSSTIGNFRLSSLSTEKSAEAIRDEKLARLSSELQEKVNRKKLQLELSYRHDCETFGLMTRKLISKDRTLENRFRLALLEVMKDLEVEVMKSLDEYLDQMIFLTA